MSGLEVIAAVAGIVSAFAGSLTIYRAWRDKKKERLENAQNRRLEVSLTTGGTTVQNEYDQHFRRLGRKFATGDGECFDPLKGGSIPLVEYEADALRQIEPEQNLLRT